MIGKDKSFERTIFVFGSNLAGRHSLGAAKFAKMNHGASYGNGVGLQGNSYAIPTKDLQIETLSLDKIKVYVDEFIEFAKSNMNLRFDVSAIGCGLAGYTYQDIAPLFEKAVMVENIFLPEPFLRVLGISEDSPFYRKSFDEI